MMGSFGRSLVYVLAVVLVAYVAGLYVASLLTSHLSVTL